MSFLGWVISLAANPVTDVREAVHALYDAIRRMWQITVDTLHIAIGALGRLANSAARLADLAWHVLPTAGRVLWWLATVYLPAVGDAVFARVSTLLARAVHELRTWVTVGLNAVLRFLTGLVNTVRATLTSLARWSADQVARLWHLLTWTAGLVRLLLTDPARLATWILPAMLRPLLRFAESRGVAIGRWLLRKSIGAALGMSHILEDVIARVI